MSVTKGFYHTFMEIIIKLIGICNAIHHFQRTRSSYSRAVWCFTSVHRTYAKTRITNPQKARNYHILRIYNSILFLCIAINVFTSKLNRNPRIFLDPLPHPVLPITRNLQSFILNINITETSRRFCCGVRNNIWSTLLNSKQFRKILRHPCPITEKNENRKSNKMLISRVDSVNPGRK